MAEPNIEKLLTKQRKVIDEKIKKYLPRQLTKKYLEFLIDKKVGKNEGLPYNQKLLEKTITMPLWNFLDRGGKRWRPVLFLLILEALGGDLRRAKDFLIIPELIHTGTLVVDDLEDNSGLRRGAPCLHLIFGQDVALNAGNLLYFLPLKVFLKKRNQLPPEVFQKAYETYIQEMVNVSLGQAIDIGWHRDLALPKSEAEYYEMCRQKTGAMARLAVKLAAIFAGASDKIIAQLAKVAEKMAVAFQIQDDILDIELNSKDRTKFGKSFGNDIKEGKKSLLVVYALNQAQERDKKTLLKILQKHTQDFYQAQKVIGILDKYGACQYARKKAEELIKEAKKDLNLILAGRKNCQKIQALMDFLIQRSY